MAGANLPAKKYSKKAPTQLRLSFEVSAEQSSDLKFIDIARALSAINRKFYRQGVYYYVNSVEIYNNETGVVDLHTLPDNWITKNAHQRGFKLFQKMNALTSDVGFTMRPKYHDFKVYMSALHHSTGSANPSLHGINALAVQHLADDWDYSKFVSADDDGDATQEADDFSVHMIGGHVGNSDNWTSISLIKSYSESRATVSIDSPNDDNITNDDPLINVFDMSSEVANE